MTISSLAGGVISDIRIWLSYYGWTQKKVCCFLYVFYYKSPDNRAEKEWL